MCFIEELTVWPSRDSPLDSICIFLFSLFEFHETLGLDLSMVRTLNTVLDVWVFLHSDKIDFEGAGSDTKEQA